MDWLKKLLEFNIFKVDKIVNNKNKTINNINILNFPPGSSYKEIREEFPEIKNILNNYFKENHKKSNQKLIPILLDSEKIKEFDVLNEIEVLLDYRDVINFIKKTTLSEEIKKLLLVAIYHNHKLNKNEDYDKFKNNSSQLQIRIFNLYCSGWVDKLVNHLQKHYSEISAPQLFANKFKEIIENKSIIFVNRLTTKASLKREFMKQLSSNKYCILHCIGSNLNKFVKKTIKEINDEFKNSDFKFKMEKKKQLHNTGYQYIIVIQFDEKVTDPNFF